MLFKKLRLKLFSYELDAGGLAGAWSAWSGPGVLAGVGVLGAEEGVSLGAAGVVVEGADVEEDVLLFT